MTIKELRAVCQSSSQSPSWASQSLYGKLNRFFSIYLTWVFIKLPFTPNQITAFGTIVFLVGCGLFAGGTKSWMVMGWLLIVISYALDAVDGEVARYRKVMKKFDLGGVYVEPVSHDVQYGWMFLPIGYGAMIATGSSLPLVAAFVASSSKLLFRLLEFRHMAAIRHMDEKTGKTYGWASGAKTPKTVSYGLYRNVSTVTGMIPIILILILLGRIEWFLYGYAVIYGLLWLFLFRRHVKRIFSRADKESNQKDS